jgi:hypothetical protein
MTLLKNAIAYVRAVPGLPADVQRDAAEQFGCRKIYEHKEYGKSVDMREQWIKALGIGRDTIAWVARLDVLLKPRQEMEGKMMPTRDFAVTLAAVAAKASEVVEDATGVTSNISANWSNRVSWAMHRATGGKPRDIGAQREHGRKGGQMFRSRSIRVMWETRAYASRRKAAAVAWRDPAHDDWKQARAALPEDLQKMSFTTLWRLLGPRNPKLKGRGRPKTS